MVGKRVKRKIGYLLLIAGVTVFFYPYVRTFFYQRQVQRLKEEFDQTKDEPSAPEEPGSPEAGIDYTALYEFMKAENLRLFQEGQGSLSGALSYEQPQADISRYGLKENRIGFISLPRIEVELPLYLGASERQMNQGAVHLTGTSYPIGGENTNAVIAAHRGASIPMFREIHKLRKGDLVYIENFRETLTYEVAETRIIQPTQKEAVLIQEGRDLITLVSCHPLGKNTQRYVVYCERWQEEK